MGFGLVFCQAHPSHFGVGVSNTWNDACVECGGSQFFVALQFTGNDFCCHMRLMHRLVSQHGLAHDVADGEDVRHVGAHLDVDVDETTVCHGHTGFVRCYLFAVGRAAHGLQHQVIHLRCGGGAALFRRGKRHLNAFGRGFGPHRFGLEHDVVKALGVHLLPDLDQVAVSALHQAVHHFHHVQACTQRTVDGAHFQADDAAAQNQHAFGHFLQRQGAGGIDHSRIVGHEGQAHGLAARSDDGFFEHHHFFGASLLLARAGGFFHFQVVGAHKRAVAAHGGDLAHFGHGGQAAGQLADDLFFVAAQLVNVDHGCAKVHTQVGHMADFIHDGGHVQQRLAGNAAHVQAHATQGGVALDDDDFQAQISRTEGGGIATGATAQHQHIAFDVCRAAEAGGGGGRHSRRRLHGRRSNRCS